MRLRIAENFRAIFYAPFYAAQALGFYAREGVDVELIGSAVAGDGVSAVLAGAIDLTWGGPMRVIKARDQNPDSPLVCFCEVVARDPFFLIGRSDRPAFRLADLAGLRLATVSEVPTPWMCLQHDLRLHGIDPASLHRIADRTMAENFAALRDGQSRRDPGIRALRLARVAVRRRPHPPCGEHAGPDVLHRLHRHARRHRAPTAPPSPA